MTSDKDAKGRLLEEAVEMIERHILMGEGRLKPSDLEIEGRKIINDDGVHHEIDLYIKVLGPRGYDAIYIFECKNWKAKVDKNEIIVFSTKIEAARAQRGFFVGTDFTKDAVAAAQKDSRIELVTATTDVLAKVQDLAEVAAWFHVLKLALSNVTVKLKRFDGAGLVDSDVDFKSATATLSAAPIQLEQYLRKLAGEAMDKFSMTWESDRAAGDYALSTKSEHQYAVGELVVNGVDYQTIEMDIDFVATVERPGIKARVSVAGRGTILQLEAVQFEGGDAPLDDARCSEHVGLFDRGFCVPQNPRDACRSRCNRPRVGFSSLRRCSNLLRRK